MLTAKLADEDDFIMDVHILMLATLEWQVIKWSGVGMPGLYNFSSCVKDDSIYVFGGTIQSYA